MRNLKKFLALVMAMVMAMSLMVTADAKVVKSTALLDEKQGGYEYFDEAIAVLNGMGIIKGDDTKNFRPADTITRAEVAAIIYRVVTADTTDNQANLYRNVNHGFVDVTPDKWYAGYVGYLWNAKIIKGVDNTHFNPSSPVTGHEVLAMILRAAGYDANNEFTGATWRITVASTAQQEGVLDDINKTNYGAETLFNPARRDVVASLVFNTVAYVNQVQWTAAFSYQKTGMSWNGNGNGGVTGGQLNPTLGEQNFGLACRTGIIVGNQATGETKTLLGNEVTATYNSTPSLTNASITGVSYEYLSSSKANTPITAPVGAGNVKGNVTTSFGITTDLKLYGHKVDMWYDYRTNGASEEFGDATDSRYFTSNFSKAYIAYDLAVMDEVVFAEGAQTKTVEPDGSISIYTAALNKGFADPKTAAVYTSDRYSRMVLDAGAVAVRSEVGLYRLIANDSDKCYDVIIELNQEVATISQINDSDYRGNYIVLGTGTSSPNVTRSEGTTGSDFGVTMAGGKGQINSGKLKGEMTFAKIKSDKLLGLLVTATEVVGTTAADSGDSKDYFYVLEELKAAFTGTISSFVMTTSGTKIQEMTLASTERYSLSGITGSMDPWTFGTYSHLVNGLTVLTAADVGVSYSFYTDAAGRVIGVKAPNDYQFVYTTFADYEIGALGTGTSGYYVYGVDWDGNKVLGKQLKSITQPYDTGTGNFSDIASGGSYKSNGNDFDVWGTGNLENNTLAGAYTTLPVTMKNQGNINAGNQIRVGNNTRYVIDSDGNLDWRDVGGVYGQRFIGWYDDSATVIRDTWSISATDAANGFLRVYNQEYTDASNNQWLSDPIPLGSTYNIGYVLTNETKFVVVTGSGTADLKVDVYTGLSGLLGTDSGAEITFNGGDNVYFKTSDDKYGNADTTSNKTIETVILSDTNLNRFSSRNLYFAAPGNTRVNGSQLVGDTSGSTYLYNLYNNGVMASYWIDESVSMDYTGALNTGANGQATYGDFYTLAKIRTVNGQPVYRATAVVTTPSTYGKITTGCFTGATNKDDATDSGAVPANRYHYVAVNEINTAEIGNKVFKVSNAIVAEAFGTNMVGGNTLTNPITSLTTLNWAIAKFDATGVTNPQFDVDVAFVYDGINVTCIYVTNIQTAAGYTP